MSQMSQTSETPRIFATAAEAAGQKTIGKGAGEDSVSFLPTLLFPDQKQEPRTPILHAGQVIRDGDWKLINTKGSRGFGADRSKTYSIALYNLKDDLSEQNNLASAMPEKVERLRKKLSHVMEGSDR